MSRTNIHIRRVIAHGEVSAAPLARALQTELRAMLQADPTLPATLPAKDVQIPHIQGSAAGTPRADTLGRMAARAIHGGLKR